MSEIKTWQERCEEHPDHQSGMVTHGMIKARMQEEIDDLRNQCEMWADACAMVEMNRDQLRAEVERLTLRTQKDSVTIARLKGELKHCHAERAAPMKEAGR